MKNKGEQDGVQEKSQSEEVKFSWVMDDQRVNLVLAALNHIPLNAQDGQFRQGVMVELSTNYRSFLKNREKENGKPD